MFQGAIIILCIFIVLLAVCLLVNSGIDVPAVTE